MKANVHYRSDRYTNEVISGYKTRNLRRYGSEIIRILSATGVE